MYKIVVHSNKRDQFINIDMEIEHLLNHNGFKNGILFLNVLHTTAGLTINENADPDVTVDLINALNHIVPDINYRHFEGNSDAHLKASLMGTSLTVPVVNGKLQLGTWQSIYFTEFDGPRKREVLLNFLPF